MAILLSLLASLSWGTADFLGGTATRRLPVAAVVGVSQAVGLVGMLLVAAAVGAFGDPVGYLGWSVLAALFGVIGLSAFYTALATGTMGVVAPIAAMGVVVPVAVGVVQGDRPSVLQSFGVVVAVLGVVLASGPELRGATGRRPLLLAGVAAIGFGLVIVFVARGARSSTAMTLLTMRAVSVSCVAVVAAVRRLPLRTPPRDLPLLAAVGIGDVGANGLFALASTRGLLSVVSVLSSLYPAVTVLLARALHSERMTPAQNTGVVAALVGVVLIASGS